MSEPTLDPEPEAGGGHGLLYPDECFGRPISIQLIPLWPGRFRGSKGFPHRQRTARQLRAHGPRRAVLPCFAGEAPEGLRRKKSRLNPVSACTISPSRSPTLGSGDRQCPGDGALEWFGDRPTDQRKDGACALLALGTGGWVSVSRLSRCSKKDSCYSV